MKPSGKRIILISLGVLLFACLIFLAVYLKRVADYKKAVEETTVNDIDITRISDGVFDGEYDVDFVCAKVEVTIQSGKIISVDILEHKNERGSAAEIIAQRIVEEQKIDVDVVSGATNSSIVIKKAVENALIQGN